MLCSAAILTLLTVVQAFPFPAECGINYIEPVNVGNQNLTELDRTWQNLTELDRT
jgi:hypothetical protein